MVVLLCTVLIALAILQYRWSGQVSEAEHERMHASLQTALNQFRAQFQNEFQRLDFLFQPDTTVLNQEDWQSYAASCESILSSSDLHLVRGIWLWIAANNGETQLYHLSHTSKRFEPEPWPSEFEPVRKRHTRIFQEPFSPGRGLRPFDRFINFDSSLILHPLVKFQPSPDRPNRRFVGFAMFQLNRAALNQEVFQELAKRCFTGPNGFVYHIAVVNGQAPPGFLYASDPGITMDSIATPDARISLLESNRDRLGPDSLNGPGGPMGPGGPREQEDPGRPGRQQRPDRRAPPPPGFGSRLDPILRGDRPGVLPVLEQDGSIVEVLAKHREGSLDAAVSRSRYRNLAVSFGILLLLAASMALVLVFARRAQRLAKLQIDFVAGVSHELRTPLAVICSAGDNLADGIVSNSGNSARKYGELIRSEARKLTAMIEQIMQFASVRSGRRQYNLRDADLNEIVLKALDQTKTTIEAAGFCVDTNFDQDLPAVNIDPVALSHVIQNLLQNALKYSGESRRMMVRTEKARTKHGVEVRLSVEDTGIGIDHEDLGHIFEPFYRGGAASAAQIHGTGLGLFMAREAVVSMGGTIAVKSTRGKGSAFTIHLPGSQIPAGSLASAAVKGNQNNAAQNPSH